MIHSQEGEGIMKHVLRSFFAFLICLGLLNAQPSICVTTANPPIVRAEGLTERIGDIVFNCTGTPNAMLSGTFTIFLNTNLSNHIAGGNTVTGTIFTVDSGSGPQPTTVQPTLNGPTSLVYTAV